ncbi:MULTISPECIES: hypothetical protein [Gammaproteobacteria]|uniref:hypothetical protein n=1 Tax=Gammaproteobacteria TaxID=1236 RepID=UPI003A925A28
MKIRNAVKKYAPRAVAVGTMVLASTCALADDYTTQIGEAGTAGQSNVSAAALALITIAAVCTGLFAVVSLLRR